MPKKEEASSLCYIVIDANECCGKVSVVAQQKLEVGSRGLSTLSNSVKLCHLINAVNSSFAVNPSASPSNLGSLFEACWSVLGDLGATR